MQDPIQYVAKVEQELTQLIHDYGDYLFMVFAFGCFAAIAAIWCAISHSRRRLQRAS